MTQHTNATSCQKRVRTVGYTTVAEVQVTSNKTCSYTLLLPASKEVAEVHVHFSQAAAEVQVVNDRLRHTLCGCRGPSEYGVQTEKTGWENPHFGHLVALHCP